MSRPRAIAVAVGVLALLLALTPFVPRGGDDDGRAAAVRRPGRRRRLLLPANAVGRSRVTPAMQSEIDRVVAAGRSVSRPGTKAGLARSAAELVRCAELDGQRYCLGVGWTDDTEADVQARVATAARVSLRTTGVTTTGDLDAAADLARKARMTPSARAAADRAELELAARCGRQGLAAAPRDPGRPAARRLPRPAPRGPRLGDGRDKATPTPTPTPTPPPTIAHAEPPRSPADPPTPTPIAPATTRRRAAAARQDRAQLPGAARRSSTRSGCTSRSATTGAARPRCR